MTSKTGQPQQVLSYEEEQERFLFTSKKSIKEEAGLMRRCLDENKLMDALHHASTMVAQLRTSSLSPTTYYELFMSVVDELRHLEQYLLELNRQGQPLADLYELVQYAGNVLPRLYLLITVGSVYIKSKEAPAKEVLRDMCEMCRGVQHPTRGLFLRDYLSQMTKDKLPDIGTSSDLGDVRDSVDFILSNFQEMNKLWVRLQHQGHTKDKDRREKERKQLRVLVGTNLVRLSQLEGLDAALFKETVFPSIRDQILNCKDEIAQEYLMEVIIQVFPDELHLQILVEYLETCGQLLPKVDVKRIVIAMMNRLVAFAQREKKGIPESLDVFEIFSREVANIIKSRNTELKDVLEMEVALLQLSLSVFPDKKVNVDTVLNYCNEALKNVAQKSPNVLDEIVQLLHVPLDYAPSLLMIFELDSFVSLFKMLDYENRKAISVHAIDCFIRKSQTISDVDMITKMLDLISPIIEDQEDQPKDAEIDQEEWEEEQNRVARLVSLLDNDEDLDSVFGMYVAARQRFGATDEKRMRKILPPLFFAALQLAERYYEASEDDEKEAELNLKKCKKIFKFVHETGGVLTELLKDQVIMLWCTAARAADCCGFEEIAFEFMEQAVTAYEERVSDSKLQVHYLSVLIATAFSLKTLSGENPGRLAKKCLQSARSLMKKSDQATCQATCSHLFWGADDEEGAVRNEAEAMDCLKKARKIADGIVESETANAKEGAMVLVDLLNYFLYYFQEGFESIAPELITRLVEYVKERIEKLTEEDKSSVMPYFTNTLGYITYRKSEEDEDGAAWSDITI